MDPDQPLSAPASPPARAAAVAPAHRWVPIRTLHARHRAQVRAHLLALDGADRTRRFGHLASDERIKTYVDQMDFDRDEIFGTFDRRLCLLTLGHLAMDKAAGSAEFALSVLARARGRGLGSQLFHHAITHARNRGVHTLVLNVAYDNAPMMAIIRRAGAAIDRGGPDVAASLALPADSLGSKLEELLDHQAAEIDFRVKRLSLRLDDTAPGGAP